MKKFTKEDINKDVIVSNHMEGDTYNTLPDKFIARIVAIVDEGERLRVRVAYGIYSYSIFEAVSENCDILIHTYKTYIGKDGSILIEEEIL